MVLHVLHGFQGIPQIIRILFSPAQSFLSQTSSYTISK